MADLAIGEETTYHGYPIIREKEAEYRVEIYADTLEEAKSVIKKCLENGIIVWPVQARGRLKR